MTTSILEQVTELREKAQEMLNKAKELEQNAGANEVQLWNRGWVMNIIVFCLTGL